MATLVSLSDSTIADLHYTLQIVMDWTDFHLHQFIIGGKRYGVSRVEGPIFSDNAGKVQLRHFNFRIRERFLYEYDFGDLWQHEIRVEKQLPLHPKKTYPVCISGARLAPPEDFSFQSCVTFRVDGINSGGDAKLETKIAVVHGHLWHKSNIIHGGILKNAYLRFWLPIILKKTLTTIEKNCFSFAVL